MSALTASEPGMVILQTAPSITVTMRGASVTGAQTLKTGAHIVAKVCEMSNRQLQRTLSIHVGQHDYANS